MMGLFIILSVIFLPQLLYLIYLAHKVKTEYEEEKAKKEKDGENEDEC